MTKVLFHGSIEGFRGQIGGLIFRRLPDGTTVVTQAPSKKDKRQKKRAKEKRSAHQKAHNKRFTNSSAYARWASRKNPIYAELAAADPMRNAYNFAISDWFHPPEIHRVERRGKHIRIEATDNILVARVQVTILDEDGKVLEKGEATRTRGNWWRFTPQTVGKTIVAEAWDLPRNAARFVLK
jgi:hypothetical protein